jgi:hypothetical protein
LPSGFGSTLDVNPPSDVAFLAAIADPARGRETTGQMRRPLDRRGLIGKR